MPQHIKTAPANSQLGIAFLFVSLVVELLSLGCGGGQQQMQTPTPSSQNKTLSSITVSPANPSVALGMSLQFQATGVFSDGTKQDMTTSVTWNTAQPAVAMATPSGKIVSKGIGTTTVTASSASVSGSDTLVVSPAALVSLRLTPANVSVAVGSTQQLRATGTFTDGSVQDMTTKVSWAASPPSVATISNTGLTTTHAVGTAAITATSGSIMGTDTLLASPATLLSIAVAPANPSVAIGNTQQLRAQGSFSDGSVQDMTNVVVWGASPASIATISNAGLATAHAVGTAMISASSGSIAATDTILVSSASLQSIAITPASSLLALGGSEQLIAAGTFSDGSTQDLTSSVTWSAANPAIATVSNVGRVLAASVGSTQLSASSGSLAASSTVTVQPLLLVNHFANAQVAGAPDGTVRIDNPGGTGANLCAMIYVFDADEQMSECCGCGLTPDGLRTLSINRDLTNNPLTGVLSMTGVIKIASADEASNPGCNPATITPTGMAVAWSTHIESPAAKVFVVNETQFQESVLSSAESTALQSDCAFINTLGSGHGTCTCGGGS